MAFTLAQASTSSGTYPLSIAPQLRMAYRRALPRRIAGALAVWSLLFSAGYCALVVLIFTDLPSKIGFSQTARWVAVCILPLLFGFLVLLAGRDVLRSALIRSLGYRRATMPSAGGPYSRIPASLTGAGSGILAASAAFGAMAGTITVITLATGEPWMISGGVAATFAFATVFGLIAVRRLRMAATGWRTEMRKADLAEHTRHTGTRVLAAVTDAVFTQSWLDGLPVFRVRVAFTADGEERQASFHATEFPRWGLTPGDAFHLWFDPDHPHDPDRIVLERKFIDQEPITNPEALRRPVQGSEGPAAGPIEPPWVQIMGGLTRGQWVAYVGGFLFSAGAIACQIVAAIAWNTANSWSWIVALPLIVGVLLNVLGIALRLRPAFSPRHVIHSTGAALVPLAVGILGMFLGVLLTIEAASAIVASEPFTDMATDHGVIAIFAGLIGGWFSLFAGLNFETPLAVALASNPQVQPEVVQEALCSGDPQALTLLEQHHGYVAGPLHLAF